MRFFEGGCFLSKDTGRIGRLVKLPPQLGQYWFKVLVAQEVRNVHSKLQIIASVALGGRSLSPSQILCNCPLD